MPANIPNEVETSKYPVLSEPDSVDFDNIYNALFGTGVVSGGDVTAQAIPNQTVQVASGVALINTTSVPFSAVPSLPILAAGAQNRIDAVVVNLAGAVTAVDGTPVPHESPTIPKIPTNSALLEIIYIPAFKAEIEADQIKDKRVFISSAGGGGGPHKEEHDTDGGDAFVKGDTLAAASRYLEVLGSDPGADVARFWLNGALLKYYDNAGDDILQIIQKRGDVIVDGEHGARGAELHADSHPGEHPLADSDAHIGMLDDAQIPPGIARIIDHVLALPPHHPRDFDAVVDDVGSGDYTTLLDAVNAGAENILCRTLVDTLDLVITNAHAVKYISGVGPLFAGTAMPVSLFIQKQGLTVENLTFSSSKKVCIQNEDVTLRRLRFTGTGNIETDDHDQQLGGGESVGFEMNRTTVDECLFELTSATAYAVNHLGESHVSRSKFINNTIKGGRFANTGNGWTDTLYLGNKYISTNATGTVVLNTENRNIFIGNLFEVPSTLTGSAGIAPFFFGSTSIVIGNIFRFPAKTNLNCARVGSGCIVGSNIFLSPRTAVSTTQKALLATIACVVTNNMFQDLQIEGAGQNGTLRMVEITGQGASVSGNIFWHQGKPLSGGSLIGINITSVDTANNTSISGNLFLDTTGLPPGAWIPVVGDTIITKENAFGNRGYPLNVWKYVDITALCRFEEALTHLALTHQRSIDDSADLFGTKSRLMDEATMYSFWRN